MNSMEMHMMFPIKVRSSTTYRMLLIESRELTHCQAHYRLLTTTRSPIPLLVSQ